MRARRNHKGSGKHFELSKLNTTPQNCGFQVSQCLNNLQDYTLILEKKSQVNTLLC